MTVFVILDYGHQRVARYTDVKPYGLNRSKNAGQPADRVFRTHTLEVSEPLSNFDGPALVQATRTAPDRYMVKESVW